MKNVISVSKRGTLTLPKSVREKYGVETPGQVEIIPEEEGIKVRAVSSFIKHFGAVKHEGKPLDFRSLRDEFEKEVSGVSKK